MMKIFFWILFSASLMTTGQACIPMKPPGEGNVPITTTTPGFTTSSTTALSSTSTVAPEDTTTTTTATGPISTTTTSTTTTGPISTTTSSTISTTSTTSTSTTSLGLETTTSSTTTTTTTSGICTLPTGDFSRVYVNAASTGVISGEEASCTCPGGMEYAFATKLTSDTNVLVSEMQQDVTLTCPDICVCDSAGICYLILMGPYDVRLFSYCEAGDCYLRAVNRGAPFFSIQFGIEVDPNDQYEMGTMTYKPITDPAFLRITRISCAGCFNHEDTCENSMGLIITRTKRQSSFISKRSEI